jgi:hypothetical protein
MKSIKSTDTDRFTISPFKSVDAVSISVFNIGQKRPRLLTALWGVRGTNAVAEYCNAFLDARESMQKALDLQKVHCGGHRKMTQLLKNISATISDSKE